MAKITKNLHEIASKDKHRVNMQHIIIDKGNFVVTDTHALLIQSLKLHDFTEDEISLLEGFCIHKDVFKELVKFDSLEVVDFGTLVGFKKGVKMATFELKETKDLETEYPSYESVIPTYDGSGVLHSIGLNAELLNTLTKCMFGDVVKLRFIAPNKAIGVEKFEDLECKPIEGQTAILMPLMLKV